MKYKGFNIKEKYMNPEVALERMQRRQEEMLKRHYTDYNLDKYVLWIIPEMFLDFNSLEISGELTVIKQDGSRVDTPYVLRNPYPNKCIHQLSLKSGRKRLYGYPLVFDTFEELCTIKEVQIKWNVFYHTYLSEKSIEPIMLHFDQLLIRYHISFDESVQGNCYTLYTHDMLPEIAAGLEVTDTYYDEFDIALEYNNDIIFYADGSEEKILVETSSLKELSAEEEKTIEEQAFRISEILSSTDIPLETGRDYLKEEIQIVSAAEMNYSQHYYESTVVLVAATLADIYTASCFGFADI